MKNFNAALFAIAFAIAAPVHAQEVDVPSAEPVPEAVPAAEIEAVVKARQASGPAMDPAPADASLLPVYKDFGELPGLTALMDDFMIGLLADRRMKPFFENVDQDQVKKHLVEQFCVILGGPCTYSGRDMRETHQGLEINRSNFNALVEVLQVAMDKHRIPFRSQNRLLAKLAPMHRDVEEK